MVETEASPYPSAANTSPALTAFLLPKLFQGLAARAQRLRATLNNSVGRLPPHRAQDKLGLETTLITPLCLGDLRQSAAFLPGFREPCREGRSVMGAWSMPSLPSAVCQATTTGNTTEQPNQQVKVGPRELCADPTESEASGSS